MKHPLLLALLSTPAALLSAQTTQTIIDRAQQSPASAPTPAAPTGVAISPSDADAGNQRIVQKRRLPFKLSASYDAQLYATSNVYLASPYSETEGAFILSQTLSATGEFAAIALGEGVLTPSAGLSYQRFYHGVGQGSTYSALDFDSYSLPLNLRYAFGANWEASASLTTNSIYSNDPASTYHDILRSYTSALSLRKLIALADNHILSMGVGASYAFTQADVSELDSFIAYRDDRNDKVDYSADVSYYRLAGAWMIGPSARVGYADYLHYQEAAYDDVNRRDLSVSLGLSISYTITPWASARLFSSYDWRNPQGGDPNDAYAYRSKTLGCGLTLSAAF